MLCSLLIAASAPNAAEAAGCDYEVDHTDKFTKVRTLRTRWIELHGVLGLTVDDFALWISALDDGTGAYLSAMLKVTADAEAKPRPYEIQDRFLIEEGAAMLIMLADETVVELHATQDETARSSVTPPDQRFLSTGKWGIEFRLVADYALNESTLASLTSMDATRLRVVTDERNFDIEIDEAFGEAIRTAIDCLGEAS